MLAPVAEPTVGTSPRSQAAPMETSVTFIGIDLGWARKNPSGVAALRGTRAGAEVMEVSLLQTDDAIYEFIERHAGDGPAIVAIDAPLRVPNTTGMRLADREISRAFRPYHAGAYPANRSLPVFREGVRGEDLVSALQARGFVHTDQIEPGQPVRQVVEVYPHPALVAIFNLERILRYKYKRRRPREERLAEWHRYQAYLNSLVKADPILTGQTEWCSRNVDDLRGRRLDDYEDATDALFCAYIALYGYRWGDARCRTFGDIERGYIYTPVPEALRSR